MSVECEQTCQLRASYNTEPHVSSGSSVRARELRLVSPRPPVSTRTLPPASCFLKTAASRASLVAPPPPACSWRVSECQLCSNTPELIARTLLLRWFYSHGSHNAHLLVVST
jgi:hypothetical protein